jgi:cystathionine beta-lyase/cystathionine gamma-synthase
MNAHQRNGFVVAQFLESHSMVRKVLYSGLKSHPQHELAVKQSSGCSGMVCIK